MVKSKITQEIIDDLKAYYGYPPHHVITNTVREDYYYKMALLEKYKCDTMEQLEKRVNFAAYHTKRRLELESWEKM